jgi:myo-inositol-1(or 4)-monophosphatase
VAIGTVSEDVELLSAVAREGGALAMKYFGHDPKSWAKGETSVVSEADLEVDRLLCDRLLAARPGYGWLSEESPEDIAQLGRNRVFVVDPIDGTRGFLAGESEWTVSLAIVENGRPVAAALFAPALDTMFQAVAGGGAERNGVLIRVSARTQIAGANLAGSRRLVRKILETSRISLEYPGFIPSLAYRIALVAAGDVDVAVARRGAYDWDLAAADLLVHEAGGRLVDLGGERPRYNGASRRHPALVASTPGLSDAMTALFIEAEREWER